MYKLIIYINLIILISSCSFSNKEKSEPVSESKKSTSKQRVEKERVEEGVLDSDAQGGEKSPFASSITNSSNSPFRVERLKLQKVLSSTRGKPSFMVDEVVLYRLLGRNYFQVLAKSKLVMNSILNKNAGTDVPDEISLELAISAFKAQKINLAEYYIRRLLSSKSKFFKSNARTLQGLIFLREKKLPEAANEWQIALKLNSSNDSAGLNLAFLALRYGDSKTARKYLTKVEPTWLSETGLVISYRIEQKYIVAREYCESLLSKNPPSKMVYISCSLNEMDGFSDKAKALALLDKGLKLSFGNDALNEKILTLKRLYQNAK